MLLAFLNNIAATPSPAFPVQLSNCAFPNKSNKGNFLLKYQFL